MKSDVSRRRLSDMGHLVKKGLVAYALVMSSPAFAQQPPQYPAPTFGAITLFGPLSGGTLSGTDASGSNVTATGTTTARTQATRAADVLNILDQAAGVGQGNAAIDTAALTTAIAKAAAAPGTTIFLPPGTYNFTPPASTGCFQIPSKTTIRGESQNQSKILWNDTLGYNLFCSAGTPTARASDIVFEDFTITGSWATNGTATAGGYPILLYYVDGLKFRRLTVEYSRIMSIAARNSTDVDASDNVVRYSDRDGISFAQCANVSVRSNMIEHTDDDAIAVHSDTQDPWGVRKNIVIADNRIFDSQGIRVLSARQASITGNQLDVVRQIGIDVQTVAATGSTYQEGASTALAVTISGNTITNGLSRTNIDNLSQGFTGITISGSSARAGTYAAIPGEANAAAGTIIDPYPEFLANSASTTVPTAGSYGIIVDNNFIGRTLPASNGSDPRFTSWTSFGFGEMFLRSGWANPSLAESDLEGTGIDIGGGVVRDVMLTNNMIRGQNTGITLDGATRLENIVMRDNSLIDITAYGLLVNTTATMRAYFLDNLIDMDPFNKSPNRGPNGTWLAQGGPTAIQDQAGMGVVVRGNHVRNAGRDSALDTSSITPGWLFENNFVEADPATVGGFSTSNKGVGMVRLSGGFRLIQTDSDPASPTFGQFLTLPQSESHAMPTTGKWMQGQIVYNVVPTIVSGQTLVGWSRLTSGTNNVLGTDWAAIYAPTKITAASLNQAAYTNPSAQGISSGGAIVLSTGFYKLVSTSGGLIATATMTLPSTTGLIEGQTSRVVFSGGVSAVTWTSTDGKAIVGAPSSIVLTNGYAVVTMMWSAILNQWMLWE